MGDASGVTVPAARRMAAKTNADGILGRLDPDQRAAASVPSGPLLIIAGPGTGKTRTLTHRIAHLVSERGVDPGEILAITFTRRAAAEMAERLSTLASQHAEALTVTTFHSLGLRVLREQHALAGLPRDFSIADPERQLAVAIESTGDPAEAKRLLAEGRRDGAPQFAAYLAALHDHGLVDLDDLIALPVALLDEHPDLAAAYRDRWRWVFVDEYQDIDDTQYRLLRLLAPANGNLTAIGDPDQAIYRFRGADVGFFLRFEQDYTDAAVTQLSRNYRSGATILEGAVQLVAPTTLVTDRRLDPAGGLPDLPIRVHGAASESAEAAFVATTVDHLLGGATFTSRDAASHDASTELGFNDIAVLYRTDGQSRAIGEALTRAGFPYQKRSHDRLRDRPGVAELLNELRFAADAPTVHKRLLLAADALRSREGADPSILDSAVDLLAPLALRCGTDADRFRDELSLGIEVDTWDPRADRITLLTLHASKGLEFPCVFVVGCEDGLLPLRWGETSDEEIAEERRLLFVGMTRAQRHLYLSHAAERYRHGTTRAATRSPFLSDLDPRLTETIAAPKPKRPKAIQPRLL
ncbi:MAG TPA: ATP-dependent helicase [Stackebrandtia sp.]|nr:ATP-dependent helicase [Stackebrandtia sp.]